MLFFFCLFCTGAAVIAAAFWDSRKGAEKRRAQKAWRETTSTTMQAGKTRHVVITYTVGDDE
jgi:hypothetical protein